MVGVLDPATGAAEVVILVGGVAVTSANPIPVVQESGGGPTSTVVSGIVTSAAPTYANNTSSGVSLDTAGNLRAVVSGVATAANQTPGVGAGSASSLAMPVQGIAGGTAVPISAATLPLPAGASTAANQTPPVSAGSAATLATPVQGIAGGVAVGVAVASTASPTKTAPAAGSNFSITTGGTAVTVFSASTIANQGIIMNPFNATESLFVDLVNTAQNVQGGGTNGTSLELRAGDSIICFPSTVAVTANAATSGHTFVAFRQ